MTTARDPTQAPWRNVLVLSLALLFFALPHSLEDFALGEPLKRGVPAAAIATVLSALVAVQALSVYLLGRRDRRGLWILAVVGVVWAIAAGAAQLPDIVRPVPYRAGAVSVAWVVGIVVVGLSLSGASLMALRAPERGRGQTTQRAGPPGL